MGMGIGKSETESFLKDLLKGLKAERVCPEWR